MRIKFQLCKCTQYCFEHLSVTNDKQDERQDDLVPTHDPSGLRLKRVAEGTTEGERRRRKLRGCLNLYRRSRSPPLTRLTARGSTTELRVRLTAELSLSIEELVKDREQSPRFIFVTDIQKSYLSVMKIFYPMVAQLPICHEDTASQLPICHEEIYLTVSTLPICHKDITSLHFRGESTYFARLMSPRHDHHADWGHFLPNLDLIDTKTCNCYKQYSDWLFIELAD